MQLFQFLTQPDPFQATLTWESKERIKIETEAKVGAAKSKHI